jgi:hypothetical protein
MGDRERFLRLVKRELGPMLRADGFRAGGNTYRRARGDRFDVVSIQGSKYGGTCCVNLASHLVFLPLMSGGRVTDPGKLREYDCVFRDRLHEPTESDHWWPYGADDAEAEAGAASLVALYRREGPAFFARFEPFPEAFDRITPEQLDAGDFSRLPAAMTRVLAALTMARIMAHLGRRGRCAAFAEVGLRHAGPGFGARGELERLRDAAG